MKTLIGLFVYAVLSAVFGLVVCGLLAWKKYTRAAWLAAAVFFGGPLAAYLYAETSAELEHERFVEDVAYVKDLCAKQGGTKIYRTVENVQGVFQMKARNPDPEGQYRDQYGMVDPWGMAMGDTDYADFLSTRGRGYWYFEQQPGFGKPDGPPYRRTYLYPTGLRAGDVYPGTDFKDDAELKQRLITVSRLRSRYGYIIEDLSTPEMRKRWIAGGRIRIVDLQTKEVLAETVGYFRAIGPAAKDRWSGSSAFQNQRICPHDRSLWALILAVLKPPKEPPTIEQLEALKGD